MSNAYDGGSAFPHGQMVTSDGRSLHTPVPGMSLRDWLAGQALAAFVKRFPMNVDGQGLIDWRVAAAQESYGLADAMLAVRREGGAV